jgi:hypothetical protein
MKSIFALLFAALLAGCSTPNPNPSATANAYEQVKQGMSRQQVLALLGTPRTFKPPGNFDQCESATWSIPHGSHGFGHWIVYFSGDSVTGVGYAQATVTFSSSANASGATVDSP